MKAISESIQQLRAKREEIDKAIAVLEGLERSGLFAEGQLLPQQATASEPYGISGMSVYEGAVSVLRVANKPLTMREITDTILASGKKISSKKPEAIISTTLYKSLRDKKDCQLVKLKTGKWGLKGWKN